jgi:vacuolar protein sorting-associated protein 13A/C
VPWNKLGQEPVVAEFDRLYIVAGPREDSNATTTGTQAQPDCSEASANATFQAALKAEHTAKEKRVNAAEQEWIKVWKVLALVVHV